MERNAHSAIVAGASSTIVTAWIRSRTRSAYDPTLDPPSIKERIRNRAPLVAAGLGFTGLSTAVAGYFDTAELALLGDANDAKALHQQLGGHRDLHSLLYLKGAVGAAHLIRHSSTRFGEWVAERLDLPGSVAAVIDAASELADWVINSVGTGVLGHLLGDLPTKGQGGSALRLLAPITNRNFCLKWVYASSKTANHYLTIAGSVLAGAAWSVSGLYILSWVPPEQSVRQYVDRIGECESAEEATGLIVGDIQSLFDTVFTRTQTTIWESSLFECSTKEIEADPASRWYQMEFDCDRLFDIPSLSPHTLHSNGIVPTEVATLTDGKSLYSPTHFGVHENEQLLTESARDSTTLSRNREEDAVSLRSKGEGGTASLRRTDDEQDESQSLFIDTD